MMVHTAIGPLLTLHQKKHGKGLLQYTTTNAQNSLELKCFNISSPKCFDSYWFIIRNRKQHKEIVETCHHLQCVKELSTN